MDGIAVPSVTQIVAAVTGKDLSRIPEDVLARARDRGIAIHDDIEHGTFETPEGRWVADRLSENLDQERVGYAEIGGVMYAGRIDIMDVIQKTIFDIKSQATKDLLAWTIQLNLYRRMYPEYDTLRVLWVPKTGKYKAVDIDILDERKMVRIMDAYLSGEVLDKKFLTAIMDEILDRNLTVSGTKEQLERLVEYMYMSGISYRRI
jgi:hypothetical protein